MKSIILASAAMLAFSTGATGIATLRVRRTARLSLRPLIQCLPIPRHRQPRLIRMLVSRPARFRPIRVWLQRLPQFQETRLHRWGAPPIP